MIDAATLNTLPRFTHEAMNTVFSIYVAADQDRERAADATHAAFERLDQLEDRLSRYRPDSEVGMINAMQTGDRLLITPDTHDCLRLAFEVYAETGGLFDVTLGEAIEHRKAEADGPAPAPKGQLRLVPAPPAVECVEAGRNLDLGGIGKGFALDRMAEVLRSWDIHSALLTSGNSTLLAIGPEAWPIALTGERDAQPLSLCGQALAASGIGLQGAHIVDPDAPDDQPAYGAKRVWTLTAQAALADAYSTVCLLLTRDDTQAWLNQSSYLLRVCREEADGQLVALERKSGG